jgi:hypothetical protein
VKKIVSFSSANAETVMISHLSTICDVRSWVHASEASVKWDDNQPYLGCTGGTLSGNALKRSSKYNQISRIGIAVANHQRNHAVPNRESVRNQMPRGARRRKMSNLDARDLPLLDFIQLHGDQKEKTGNDSLFSIPRPTCEPRN